MPSITIRPQGQTLRLTAVTNAAGTALTPYNSAALITPVTLPAQFTANLTVWLAATGPVVVTVVRADGVTVFSGTINAGDTPIVLSPQPTAETLAADGTRTLVAGIGDTSMWGIVGNNSTATDGARLQAACDDLIERGATFIRVAGGAGPKIKVTGAPIITDSDVAYDFTGTTVAPASGANLDAFVTTRAAHSQTATTFDTSVKIIGGTFDGNRSNQTGGAGHGLVVATGNANIRDVKVVNTRGDGIVLSDTNGAGTVLTNTTPGVENYLENCWVGNTGGTGIRLMQSGGGTLTDWFLRDCITAFTYHNGIRVDSLGGGYIVGCHVYAAGLSGVVGKGSLAARIRDNYIEGFGVGLAAGNTTGTAIDKTMPAYNAGTTYTYNHVVTYSSTIMISQHDDNTGNTPDITGADTTHWRPYILLGAAVAGLSVSDIQPGRGTLIDGNNVSLGHQTIAVNAGMNYRGLLVAGPNTGLLAGVLHLGSNDIVSDFNSGTNTLGVRVAKSFDTGTGGVKLVRTGITTVRGSWNSGWSVDSSAYPTVVKGAALGTGASAAVVTTSSTSFDEYGSLTLTTGTSPTAGGLLATVTFKDANTVPPVVAVNGADAASAALGLYAVPLANGTGWELRCTGTPSGTVTVLYSARRQG